MRSSKPTSSSQPDQVESGQVSNVIRVHLELIQYPLLGRIIRERMRQELFRRGIITHKRLEDEAREKAIDSQKREGIANPFAEETATAWEQRLQHFRDALTEFYFGQNLPHDLFRRIIEEAVLQRSPKADTVRITYNPELAPPDLLFAQGLAYEALPAEQRQHVQHDLQEIKVVLIKGMISDQLAFIRVAREYLTMQDLRWIDDRRIGPGKIGGKAAGMILAHKILQSLTSAQGHSPLRVVIPESFFLGADVFYDFMAQNDLQHWVNQKYKTPAEIEQDYPKLRAAYLAGRFPKYVLAHLEELLAYVKQRPLIVRSSSLLEDNFETSFAGKYESVFLPNQGSPRQNLAELTRAIASIYASVANLDVLLYRKRKGLLDYDERMAILIQVVQGERYHDFFFPTVAGVAFSRNPFLWNPQLRREDGFARIVVGLGTRAVERVGDDYTRMVALSHPRLRPESDPKAISHYAQHYIDLINLKTNRVETRRITETLAGDYPGLRYLASLNQDDYITSMIYADRTLDPRQLVLTFDNLLVQTPFVEQLKTVLKTLEFGYGRPVDIEFTVALDDSYPRPNIELHLLQCRPLSSAEIAEQPRIPDNLPEASIIFGTGRPVPTGRVSNIVYIVYVDPHRYQQIGDHERKFELARLVGRINRRLEGQSFILMGPGRWGTNNPDLGLKVGFADFYNTKALIEIGLPTGQGRPTLSYGTHFFQDLVEARIYPLAIYPGEPGNPFRWEFFTNASNALSTLLPAEARFADYVKVIHVPAVAGDQVLELVMSGEQGRAVAYLTRPGETK